MHTFMIPIIRHFGKGKTIKIGSFQGLEEGMKSILQRIFRAVKLFIVILQIHAITHLSKCMECTTLIMNHSVNYGLWVIMMYQCKFINCDKCTTLIKDTDNRGGCCMCGNYLLLNIAMNLKLLKK